MLGDPTAKEQRRLSLNPFRHVDPVGTVILPGILALSGAPVFGWAKPVPVNARRLNNPRFGMMAVAAAGPATNLVLALIGALLVGLLLPDEAQVGQPLSILGSRAVHLHFDQHVPGAVQPDPAAAVRWIAHRRGAAARRGGARLWQAAPVRPAAAVLVAAGAALGLSAVSALSRTSCCRRSSGRRSRSSRQRGSSRAARPDAERLDNPRQAGGAWLDTGRGSREAQPAAGRLLARSRSAMAARSIRWRAGCCRSLWARRPSWRAGCSMPARSMSSPCASGNRPIRSISKAWSSLPAR